MGADALISSPSCGIFVGEDKCLDQGTVLLHGGEDEAEKNIIPFCEGN